MKEFDEIVARAREGARRAGLRKSDIARCNPRRAIGVKVVVDTKALLATSPYRNVVVIRPRDFMDNICS